MLQHSSVAPILLIRRNKLNTSPCCLTASQVGISTDKSVAVLIFNMLVFVNHPNHDIDKPRDISFKNGIRFLRKLFRYMYYYVYFI